MDPFTCVIIGSFLLGVGFGYDPDKCVDTVIKTGQLLTSSNKKLGKTKHIPKKLHHKH